MRFGHPLSFGEVPHTNPTVVPYRSAQSPSPPESAWIAEYLIKHDYSAQERAGSHTTPLRARGESLGLPEGA